MNQVKNMVVLAAFGAVFAASAFEVTGVTARQRWPWNSLIDVDFEIAEATASDRFSVGITATCDGGTRTIVGKTYRSDIICASGSNRLVWDFGADAPGCKTSDLRISVTATPFASTDAAYCVIDLSEGPNAEQYPVRYTLEAPVHTQGASGEPCQTTEMWLKRVVGGKYAFRATDSNHKGNFQVCLTKAFYCAVFECTQQQWYQVMGTWPSKFVNEECRASRPVECVTHVGILGQTDWPDDKSVSADSFVGRMRARAGLTSFNLPTEAQWEYVERAGNNGSYIGGNAGLAGSYARYKVNSGDVSTYQEDATVGTAFVGSYLANPWGFYDMTGNVAEWTLDTYGGEDSSGGVLTTLYADEIADPGYVTDPQGPANSTSETDLHTIRGGGYASIANDVRLFARTSANSAKSTQGARFVFTCE